MNFSRESLLRDLLNEMKPIMRECITEWLNSNKSRLLDELKQRLEEEERIRLLESLRETAPEPLYERPIMNRERTIEIDEE